MTPHIGLIVLYRYRPGQVRAGQLDDAAIVTRVHADGSVNLDVFADGLPDRLHFNNVPPMSDAVQSHCWHDREGGAGSDISNDELLKLAMGTNIPSDELLKLAMELSDRVAALEAKRGPGRPPNARSPEAA